MNISDEKENISRLRKGTIDFDNQAIPHLIENVERKIRIMCRAMQVYVLDATENIDNLQEDYGDLIELCEVFYEYIDHQMDRMATIRQKLDAETQWVSFAGLRESEDFKRQPMRYAEKGQRS